MKALREGFTTGSCAAAAALASCLWQRDGECPRRVEITVPEGRVYRPDILPREDGYCGVVKDSGDDPDITCGMEVRARVELLPGDGPVEFVAGDGVGVVTEPGLKIPPGQPAINPVPRKMIEDAVRSVYGGRAARVTVAIPGGRERALSTFNPRLGIRGGLSVLGTSGIVRPMSLEALKASMAEELKMRAAQGVKKLLFAFGNQGETALTALFPGVAAVQVSNEIGFMLDTAAELGFESILLGGHPGKLSKVAAGVMQTHSRTGDARREAIMAHLALLGAPKELAQAVYACNTTDEAIRAVREAGYDAVWDSMARAAERYCSLRSQGRLRIRVVFIDAQGRLLSSRPAEI